jgi:hypothetical protein
MEITIHTGGQGERHILHVAWFDENNVRQLTELEVALLSQDKPRTLLLLVNGVLVATVPRTDP